MGLRYLVLITLFKRFAAKFLTKTPTPRGFARKIRIHIQLKTIYHCLKLVSIAVTKHLRVWRHVGVGSGIGTKAYHKSSFGDPEADDFSKTQIG
jgi:hypothetical protein